MTDFEQMFLDTMSFYETRNIPVFLHGSTLLRVIRDNTVQPRPDVIHDKEINIAIRAEDFTERLYVDLRKNHLFFNPINNLYPNSMIFYGKNPVPDEISKSQWDINPGFVLLAKYWRGKTKRVEYMGQTYCLEFPAHFFDTFSTVEVLGKEFLAPSDPEEYLTYYFGEWKTENKGWHWSGANCLRDVHNLEGGGEL